MSGTELSIKSKSIWAGVLLMVYAILKYSIYGDFDANAFLTGLGIIGIRHAIAKSF